MRLLRSEESFWIGIINDRERGTRLVPSKPLDGYKISLD